MIWAFLITAIIVELTPGPNMTWLAVIAATQGRGPAFAAVAGIGLGLALSGLVAGLGLTVLFENFPGLLVALRFAGTFYLFYLAFQAWTAAGQSVEATALPIRAYFNQGFLSNALNPKAYLFYGAILPQFFTLNENPGRELALLTATYVAVATIIHAFIGILAGSISGWLATSPSATLLRRALAVLIGVAALWFFISTGNMS